MVSSLCVDHVSVEKYNAPVGESLDIYRMERYEILLRQE